MDNWIRPPPDIISNYSNLVSANPSAVGDCYYNVCSEVSSVLEKFQKFRVLAEGLNVGSNVSYNEGLDLPSWVVR